MPWTLTRNQSDFPRPTINFLQVFLTHLIINPTSFKLWVNSNFNFFLWLLQLLLINFASARISGSWLSNLLPHHPPYNLEGKKHSTYKRSWRAWPTPVPFWKSWIRMLNNLRQIHYFLKTWNFSFALLLRENRGVKYHFWLQVSDFMQLMALIWKNGEY